MSSIWTQHIMVTQKDSIWTPMKPAALVSAHFQRSTRDQNDNMPTQALPLHRDSNSHQATTLSHVVHRRLCLFQCRQEYWVTVWVGHAIKANSRFHVRHRMVPWYQIWLDLPKGQKHWLPPVTVGICRVHCWVHGTPGCLCITSHDPIRIRTPKVAIPLEEMPEEKREAICSLYRSYTLDSSYGCYYWPAFIWQ